MPCIAITAVTLRDERHEVLRALRELGYDLAIHPETTPPTPEQQRELLREAIGLIAGPERITRETLRAAPRLRVISRNGVGVDSVDLDAATERGIVVTYVPDAMTNAVADLTFALLLALARRIPELDAATKRGAWARGPAWEVTGQTLGLVGVGRIGLAVAERAAAFRMRLLGFDPVPNPAFEALGGRYVPLEALLEESDFVSLHAPATPTTRHLLGARELARMKRSAFLVNCARGALVDEAALLEALEAGRLAGAGLDVFSEEPPSPGSPAEALARHPAVIATPHVASFTPRTALQMAQAALENLLTALRGERPAHVANPEVYARAEEGSPTAG